MRSVLGKIGQCTALTSVFVLLGCASSDPPAPAKPAAPAAAAPAAPAGNAQNAAATAPGGPNPQAAHSMPPGANMANNSQAQQQQQMQMQQQQHAQMGGGNPNASKDQAAMAEAMKKQQAMASQSNQAPNMSNNPNNPEMMKKMQMQHSQMGSGSAPPGTAAPAMPATGSAGSAPKTATNQNPSGAMPGMGGQGAPPKTKKKNSGDATAQGGPNSQNPNGAGPNGQGQGQGNGGEGKPKYALGSIDDVLSKFVAALAEDDTATASDYISIKSAVGAMAKMRDGDLSEEKIEEIVDLFKDAKFEASQDPPGAGKRVIFNNKGQMITFTLKKEKDNVYKITDLAFKTRKNANSFAN